MSDPVVPSGLVGNIQKYSLHDGPGIRTIVFLKGCPLRCLWCANPEAMAGHSEPWLDTRLCRGCGACVRACPSGRHVLSPGPEGGTAHGFSSAAACVGCGRCVAACPAGALTVCGQRMTVSEVVAAVMEDEAFYRTSGGGVTISGGEVLAQPEFARAVLAACRNEGLHTAIETSGCGLFADLSGLARLCDLILYDIKHLDSAAHRRLTGRGNGLILENLARLLDAGAAVVVRVPLIPGHNDDADSLGAIPDHLQGLARRGGRLLGLELLPYHTYGVGKYARLGRDYPLAGLEAHTPRELEVVEAMVRTAGLAVRIVGPA